jgi:hypothetical protein
MIYLDINMEISYEEIGNAIKKIYENKGIVS